MFFLTKAQCFTSPQKAFINPLEPYGLLLWMDMLFLGIKKKIKYGTIHSHYKAGKSQDIFLI